MTENGDSIDLHLTGPQMRGLAMFFREQMDEWWDERIKQEGCPFSCPAIARVNALWDDRQAKRSVSVWLNSRRRIFGTFVAIFGSIVGLATGLSVLIDRIWG